MQQPPPVSAMPPPMMSQPQASAPHMGQNANVSQTEQNFYAKCTKLVASVKPENQHMKQTVGNAIFDFVQQLTGQELAPKVTGMLIDLSHQEIQLYLQNYTEFQRKVNEAGGMLQGMQPKMPAPQGVRM